MGVSETKLIVRPGLNQLHTFLFREQHQNVENIFKILSEENKSDQSTKSVIVQSSYLC